MQCSIILTIFDSPSLLKMTIPKVIILSFFHPLPPPLTTVSVPSPVQQKASSFHGTHVGRGDSIPPPLPPANKPAATLDSSSTAAAISTMARHTSDANVNGHGGGSSHTSKPKKGGLFSFGKHKVVKLHVHTYM